jgi:hypothetical protein
MIYLGTPQLGQIDPGGEELDEQGTHQASI